MEIELTKGQKTVIDDADWPIVSDHSWHASERTTCGVVRYYAAARVRDGEGWRFIYMHRLLMGEPPGELVDHRDGDSLNNRRSNLRLATRGQNRANARKHARAASRYKGVWRQGEVWRAGIYHGKTIHLGTFDSEEEAARAYDAAARRLKGEFALTNFPEVAGAQQCS